jgi:2-hydroxy-6-oxonona-2,4-dienedioate hydrolase
MRDSIGPRARMILLWIGLGLCASLMFVAIVYTRDMNRAYERIHDKSRVVDSPYGKIEYSEGGSGPNVLVIHGSGGGYDQAELMVRAILSDQFHWIAPSRFGYLQSTFTEGATFDEQAHAYARLLDHLGIQKVAVLALSHGGPSALLFAVLYPDRVSSLTLISCGVASSTIDAQSQANQKGAKLAAIFQHDLLYWGVSKLFHKQLLELMGANDAVVAKLTPEQRQLADQVIDYMNPVAPRSVGAAFDNTAKMPNERIAAIRAPTLVFHATDDTLQLYHNAEFAAATIPGARLVRFERGGHLLMIVEQAAMRSGAQRFIRDHAN